MINYDTLSVLLRILLMLCLFIILCGSIHMLVLTVRKKSIYFSVPTFVCVIISAGMMILYTADVRSIKKELAPAAVSRWFCEQPLVYIILIMAVIAAFLSCLFIHEMRLRKTTLTRSSIKESIDHLPTGLCFYAENGRIRLVNHQMNRLCYILLGRELQNAALMWDDLCKGNIQPDIVPLSMGSQPSFRLPDGTVWSFSRTELDGVFQITAADITQLHNLAEELKQKNTALEALYQRLRTYEKNVEALTQERERLETKVGIHSELGQTLLATRSYLLSDKDNKSVPTDAWKNSIALLRQKSVPQTQQFSLQTLIRTAAAFGVSVEVIGQMPERIEIEKLFLEAAAEALTNAVRHAEAKTLQIRLTETDTDFEVCFRNDGKVPQAEIAEGGGLSSLRRKVETLGGSMQIICQPEYSLTITMPKGGNENI